MLLNLDMVLKTQKGEDFKPAQTLADVCFMAADATIEGDEKAPLADRMNLYRISGMMVKAGVQEVASEEITLIKTRLGKIAITSILGAAIKALEGGALVKDVE